MHQSEFFASISSESQYMNPRCTASRHGETCHLVMSVVVVSAFNIIPMVLEGHSIKARSLIATAAGDHPLAGCDVFLVPLPHPSHMSWGSCVVLLLPGIQAFNVGLVGRGALPGLGIFQDTGRSFCLPKR